eukprot:5995095-Amphidinium_carterae.1
MHWQDYHKSHPRHNTSPCLPTTEAVSTCPVVIALTVLGAECAEQPIPERSSKSWPDGVVLCSNSLKTVTVT